MTENQFTLEVRNINKKLLISGKKKKSYKLWEGMVYVGREEYKQIINVKQEKKTIKLNTLTKNFQ